MRRILPFALTVFFGLSAPLAIHAADTTRPSRKPEDRKVRVKDGLSSLTTEVLKARLAREGWSLLGKGNVSSGFFIVPVTKNSSLSGAAVLGVDLDEDVISTFIQAITNNPGASCETNGTSVLCMLIPSDQAASEALVRALQER